MAEREYILKVLTPESDCEDNEGEFYEGGADMWDVTVDSLGTLTVSNRNDRLIETVYASGEWSRYDSYVSDN